MNRVYYLQIGKSLGTLHLEAVSEGRPLIHISAWPKVTSYGVLVLVSLNRFRYLSGITCNGAWKEMRSLCYDARRLHCLVKEKGGMPTGIAG